MTLLASGLVGLVRVYQWTLRPVIGPNCRFWPSCSEYAVEALCTHGALKGGGLAARRILRCNPWHPGGYDPVPACEPARSPRLAVGRDDEAASGPSPARQADTAASCVSTPPRLVIGADDILQPRHAAGVSKRRKAAGPNPKAL